MFKMAKYYMLLRFYSQSKRSLLAIAISLSAMILLSYIFSDYTAMSDRQDRYTWITLKWIVMLSLFGIVLYHIRKVMQYISLPFTNREETQIDKRKEKLLQKERLHSRADLIIEKYRSRQ